MNLLFEGRVIHSRLGSPSHHFAYPVYFFSFEIDKLPQLRIPLLSHNRFNLLSIWDKDYLERGQGNLRVKVERLLQKAGFHSPMARIVLITSPKFLGYVFNPVSFFLCYTEEGALAAAIAEVSNTFQERHVYIATEIRPDNEGAQISWAKKVFHVSPFYNQEGQYRFRFHMSTDRASIRVELHREGRLAFVGQVDGNSRSLSLLNILKTLIRYPLTSFLTTPRILWQAALLYYVKRLPVTMKPQPESPWTIRVKRPSFVQKLCMKIIVSFLSQLKRGQLRLRLPEGEEKIFGNQTASSFAQIQVYDFNFFRRLLLSGDIGFGESYTKGEWSTTNLTAVLEFFIQNWGDKSDKDLPWSTLGRRMNRIRHLRRSNTISGSQKNISAHYDLSNDFFSKFLDPTMTYSSGIFKTPVSSLEEAQLEKIDRMIALAKIDQNDHVLEIGCGWGSFAIRAAQKTGCRVTGISLSDAQLKEAELRVRQAGLSDKISLQKIDYRHLTGTFDKIVSIEMLEAVGHKNFQPFFSALDRLLKPNGLVALQVITIPDHRYKSYIEGADWIQKYIFPGGELPSISALSAAMAQSSRLSIENLENFAQHYAQTLREWRRRFHQNLSAIKALGFSDEFIRTWDYYLCYCEAGFNERVISVLQLQLSRPQNQTLRK